MSKAEDVRFARVFHSVVAIFMLLAGGALLGFGIWLSVTGNKGPFNLDYGGQNVWRYLLVLPVICMVLGAFLIITALVALVALAKNCIGTTFRVIYVILAAIILIVLVFICVVSTFLYRNKNNQDVETFVRDAWQRTVLDQPDTICAIEHEFKCRGFATGDCTYCVTGLEPQCSSVSTLCAACSENKSNTDYGCYNKLLNKLISIFLPVAIVSGILGGIQLIDMFLLCCL